MNKLTQLFKARRRAHQTQPNLEHRLFQPSRDWFIGLLLFLVVVGSGSTASAVMFLRYSDVGIKPPDTTTALPRYNQQVVTEVLSVYQNRIESYQSLKSGIRGQVMIIESVVEVATSSATTTGEVAVEVPPEAEPVASVPVLE